jgi:hypothetical protein
MKRPAKIRAAKKRVTVLMMLWRWSFSGISTALRAEG